MRQKFLLIVILLMVSNSLLIANLTIINDGNNQVNLINNLETEISINYHLNSISAREYSSTDGDFTQLYLENFGLTGDIGNPQLPYSSKIIAVPEGAKVVTKLSAESPLIINLNDEGINNKIFPAQPPVSKSSKPEDIVFVINEETYANVDYIPQTQVEVSEIGYQRGMRLFEVNYYPVSYNPTKNTMSIIQKATLDIQFIGADLIATQNLRDKTFSPAFEANYVSTIFNYRNNRSSLESYPLGYVIVAPSNYLDTLEPFIEWKTQQGYDVTILNTSTVGSTTSSIQSAIEDVWDSATTTSPAPSYLLICGDVAQVPAFDGDNPTDSNHITDLPYVKLEGSDYLPEMYYGRFSATSTSQLATIVNKTLMYEKYEMPDPSYLERATLIAGVDDSWAPTHGNGTINYGSQYYFNSAHDIDATTYPYPDSEDSASDIIADVNAGLGYLNYTAHGSETTWYSPSFTVSNVNSLTNSQQYPVVVGNCCLTNNFDTATCFGESWLRASNGAVIYIGGTNSTYWDEDYWWSVGHFADTDTANPTYAGSGLGMFDALFHENGEEYVNWVNSAGSMVYRGNMAVQASSSTRKEYYWEIYSIMGDPSLIPMVGIPDAQTPNYDTNLIMGATSMNVTAAPYSYVSLTVDGVIIGTQLLGSTGSGTVSFPALSTPQNVKMVISRVDYQPYIAEIPVITANGPYLSLASYTVNDNNNNDLLEYGETASLNLVIDNIGTSASSSGTITFSESDPYLSLTSTSAVVSAISADGSVNINNVINFSLANNIPNNYNITLSYIISADGEEYPGNLTLIGKSYDMEITNISIDDSASGNGNNIIDAGEAFNILVTVENNGEATSPANNLTIEDVEDITYTSSSIVIPAIAANDSQEVSFTATASTSITAGQEVTFTVNSSYLNGDVEFSQDFLAALLQIGEGAVTDAHLPMEPYFRYTYSQSIYTASELNLGISLINKIAYQYNGNSTWDEDVVLYMGNTTKSSFSSTSDWVALTNLTEVYNGSFTAPETTGWIEIELSTPFIYDGTSNLVIGFDNNTYDYHNDDDEFYCYASGSNRSIYYFSDSTNPDPASPSSMSVSSNNPNLRIFASAVTSEPSISLNPTTLDFGEVIIGESASKDFTITNTGLATLEGTITLPNNFSFSARENAKDINNLRTAGQNFSVPAGNNQTYSVTFTPTVGLCYNNNLTITHNGEDSPATITLTACGINPTYSSTTRLINKTLAPDFQDTYNYVIENTGSGDLEVLLEITDAERNSGGPDTYGYTWKDSNEAGVSYDWIDISASGTVVAEGTDDSEEITLPFTFNFYGEDYTSVNVCTNGFLSFTSTETTYTNESIPSSSTPNALIAAFWDDLKPYGDDWGNVYYQNFSTYSVIQWENVSHYDWSEITDPETFQIILYSNGDIKYQYKVVADDTSCTVGIENQTGTDGLLLTYNSTFLENEYAIMFSAGTSINNWLSLSSDALTIPGYSSETVTVSFDATGLELGTYHKNIYILTNDPDLEEITVPVTLIVGGSTTPDILVDTQSIDFGRVMASDFVLDTVTITNIGNEILRGSIRATNSFTITEARANISKNEIISAHQGLRRIGNFEFILANGISKSYNISHSTTLAGSYDGELIISSNDPENPEVSVPLALEVVNPPSINVNPESIGLTLLPDQTTSRDLTISNTGDLDLNCNLSLQANEERYIIEIFSANFDDNDLTDWTIDFNYNVNDTWHIAEDYDGYDLDGSSFLFIDSDEAGSNDLDDTIESPSFNISDYSEITVEFDHYFNAYGDEIADVDLWTGTEWINIGSWADDDIGYWSSPSHFIYTLTNEGYSDVKLRFHYYDANWDWYWAIDNLVVSGEGTPVPQWVTMDSVFDSFTVTPNSNQDITLNFSSIDFEVGVYFATLNIQSNSSETSSIDIPITFIINELENEPNWQPVIYPNNSATIYAEVTHLSNEISEDDIVSAWVGDECRGIGSIVLVDRSQAFTTMVIQSNGSAENICFKFYDRSEDMVIEESNATPISSGQVVGSALEPFPINIGIVELIAPNYLDVEITRNMANINWIAVPNADFYKVFYSSDSESWTELGQTVETSYQHNQPRSQAHFYKVKAIMD